PNLAFIGLCIVNGPLFPVAELQARWAARVFAGKIRLPAPASMHRQIHEQKRAATRRGAHPLRVQLLNYMDALAKQLGVAPKLLRHPRLMVPQAVADSHTGSPSTRRKVAHSRATKAMKHSIPSNSRY